MIHRRHYTDEQKTEIVTGLLKLGRSGIITEVYLYSPIQQCSGVYIRRFPNGPIRHIGWAQAARTVEMGCPDWTDVETTAGRHEPRPRRTWPSAQPALPQEQRRAEYLKRKGAA